MVIGHLNASHATWSYERNIAGTKLQNSMEERGLKVRNPYMITYPPNRSNLIGEAPLIYDKANWGAIKTELLLLDEGNNDLRSIQSKFMAIVLKYTPRTRPNTKAFWNKKLEKNRKEVLDCLRRNTRSKEFRHLRNSYQQEIAKTKLESQGRALQEETDQECHRAIKLKQSKHLILTLHREDSSTAR
ncbi:hypothetical protein C7212DRAFT_340160 [Tuber magnatum]|uniref:Uncharacterized protein n=1 Tax=Tuber magnatum TaxID=42249 RepID=A0A317SY57_9PEZI|nr:hypothetical protein C7212DRAFT_340160 [Tuber magnatum]